MDDPAAHKPLKLLDRVRKALRMRQRLMHSWRIWRRSDRCRLPRITKRRRCYILHWDGLGIDLP